MKFPDTSGYGGLELWFDSPSPPPEIVRAVWSVTEDPGVRWRALWFARPPGEPVTYQWEAHQPQPDPATRRALLDEAVPYMGTPQDGLSLIIPDLPLLPPAEVQVDVFGDPVLGTVEWVDATTAQGWGWNLVRRPVAPVAAAPTTLVIEGWLFDMLEPLVGALSSAEERAARRRLTALGERLFGWCTQMAALAEPHLVLLGCDELSILKEEMDARATRDPLWLFAVGGAVVDRLGGLARLLSLPWTRATALPGGGVACWCDGYAVDTDAAAAEIVAAGLHQWGVYEAALAVAAERLGVVDDPRRLMIDPDADLRALQARAAEIVRPFLAARRQDLPPGEGGA